MSMGVRMPNAINETVPYTVEPGGAPNVAVVRCEVDPSTEGGWEQWVLLVTDQHHDNPHTDQKMEKRHLDEAVARNAAIVMNGDTFCAMQGKYDKRSDKSCVRPEHQCSNYLDALVNTAVDFYAPYAPWIVQIGEGNHETAIKKRHETDLTQRLIGGLNALGGNVQPGGYSGWVAFAFRRIRQQLCHKLWRIHGYAGGGQVTADMIQAQRQMAYKRDATIMFSGHTHDKWYRQFQIDGLDKNYTPYQRTVHYIKGSSYKDEYGDGHGGWHVETGKPPKPAGAWWLRFYWAEQTVQIQVVSAE